MRYKALEYVVFSATLFSYHWNSTGTIIAGTGTSGLGANQLFNPYGLALDSQTSLYVVDRGNDRVQKYLSGTLSGSTVAGQASGTSGTGSTVLKQLGYLVVDS